MSGALIRIKQYLDLKGISVRAFELKCGFSNGSFASQLKNGKTIGIDRLENILNAFPDINIEWLLTGKGSMAKTDTVPLPKNDQTTVAIGKRSDKNEGIPLIQSMLWQGRFRRTAKRSWNMTASITSSPCSREPNF